MQPMKFQQFSWPFRSSDASLGDKTAAAFSYQQVFRLTSVFPQDQWTRTRLCFPIGFL